MEAAQDSAWQILLEKLSSWLDAIVLSIPNIVLAVVCFGLAFWLARVLRRVSERLLRSLVKVVSIRQLIANIFSVIVVMIGFLMALAILNLDGTVKSLLAGAGVAGLAVSLALQGVLSNTFSGIFLAVKDELNVGDYIETNGYAGEVISVDLRNTKLREVDNNIVVIPNRQILDKPFKNYGLTTDIRTTIECGVAYDSDLELVEHISLETVRREFDKIIGKEPEFFFTEYGTSSINFKLRFWTPGTRKRKAVEVKSQAIKALTDAFSEHDISIPYPTREVISNFTLQDATLEYSR